MESGKQRFLKKVLEWLQLFMFLLVSLSIAIQVYVFNEYRRDVRGNRAILCESKLLAHERYCVEVVNIDPPGKL